MNELDKIDLELFKACGFRRQTLEELPKSERHPANIRWIGRNDNMVIMRPQFTKDIQACFSVLIPEMNRRGIVLKQLYQYLEINTNNIIGYGAEFVSIFGKYIHVVGYDPEPQIAISKAAYAALKGEGVAK